MTGRFLVAGGALPHVGEIASDQPEHVGYNPAISGLNLNYNRVNFEWKRDGGGYAVQMDARGERFVPMVRRIAWHVHGGGRPGIELEDLMQAGMVALTEAAQRHAGPGEDGFAAYAKLRVRGAMVDLIRRHLPGTRGGAERRRQLRDARRRGDRTPVMVLTARNRTDERIAGLDAGADDYLGKPFDLEEVEARLRALVRRTQGADDVVRVGRLELQRKNRRILVDDADLALPAREFEVLWELMTPPGRAVSKRVLSDKLSSFDEALGDNALEAFISRLRKKLTDSGATIRTLRGIGYLLEDA